MKGYSPNERQVQRSILAMARACFPKVFLHHSPNGAHLSGDNQARCLQVGALKGDGMRPGFPDLIALWDGGVALLEVKSPKGTISEAQTNMHGLLGAIGHAVAIVRSDQEAYDVLKARGAPCVGQLKSRTVFAPPKKSSRRICQADARTVECPTCGAAPGMPCTGKRRLRIANHAARRWAA